MEAQDHKDHRDQLVQVAYRVKLVLQVHQDSQVLPAHKDHKAQLVLLVQVVFRAKRVQLVHQDSLDQPDHKAPREPQVQVEQLVPLDCQVLLNLLHHPQTLKYYGWILVLLVY
jgi:hypothetical protein